MPFLAPIVAAYVGTALASTAAYYAAYAITYVASIYAISRIAKALQKKPQSASFSSEGRTTTTRQPISPWQVIFGKVRVGGVLTFRFISADRQDWHMVVTFACHQCEAIDELWFDDQLVWTPGGGIEAKWSGYVTVQTSLGAASDAQPFPDLVTASGGRWSNMHLQYGHTKAYIKLKANPDLFPGGVPNVTAIIRGENLVYDDRDASTGYSNNATLVRARYLTSADYGMGADFADEIDPDDFAAAANTDDEAVSLNGGGTEARYTVNGAFVLSEKPSDILARLNAACAGSAVYVGSRWHLLSGAYYAPTITLSEGDFAGPISVQTHVDDRDSANGVKGVFTSPNASWQPTDFPAIASATYMAEDNGERQWKDVDYTAFVTSVTQAQRLAKIELLRARQGLTAMASFRLGAFALMPGKTVSVSFARYGWTPKVFEVVECGLAVGDEEEGRSLQVPLVLRETAAAIFDWSTSEEQAEDIAPNTTLPDPGYVPPPGVPAVVEEQYETAPGRGVATKAILTCTPSSYPFRAQYQFEYKLHADAEYTPLLATREPKAELLDVAPGYYDFRVKAIGSLGAESDYATRTLHEIVGLGAAPGTPVITGLQALGGGFCILSIEKATELAVLRGGRVRIRHDYDLTTASWSTAFSIGEINGYPGDATLFSLPLKHGTYFVKFENQAGVQSATEAQISSKQVSLLTLSSKGSVTEDSSFTGTKTNLTLSSGALELTDPASDGLYQFAAGLDFGAVIKVRVTTQVQGIAFIIADLIDSRTGDIDSWVNFDGTDSLGSTVDCWVECRETDDDPSGSPTWSDWKRLDVSEFECRGMVFRAQFRSFDPAYNLSIDTMRIAAEGL